MKETEAGTQFDVFVRNTYYDTFEIPMFGKHHVLNALSVVAICHYEGIPAKDIQHLRSFQGVKRRFTEKKIGQQVLIDRKSTRLNSSHVAISYAVFCLK